MGHPLRQFPLALQGSVSGAWRAGFTSTTNVDCRSVNAGKSDSQEKSGAAWIVRGFGSPGHPLLLFPLALQGSVSGARRAGFTITTSDDRRSVSAGKTDSRDKNGARR